MAIDTRTSDGPAICLEATDLADVVIEVYPPGVMERLGLGRDVPLARNPRLVHGRMTGWAQDGPLARRAGHDINYRALTGPLHAIGHAGRPATPPLNLAGDFGGGSLYLAMGAREVFVGRDGVTQPAPAPRFSRTPGAIRASGEGQAMLDRWAAATC